MSQATDTLITENPRGTRERRTQGSRPRAPAPRTRAGRRSPRYSGPAPGRTEPGTGDEGGRERTPAGEAEGGIGKQDPAAGHPRDQAESARKPTRPPATPVTVTLIPMEERDAAPSLGVLRVPWRRDPYPGGRPQGRQVVRMEQRTQAVRKARDPAKPHTRPKPWLDRRPTPTAAGPACPPSGPEKAPRVPNGPAGLEGSRTRRRTLAGARI